MARAWSALEVGVLLVSERADGTFAVWDGQHRLEAGKLAGHALFDCFVYSGMTVEEEAWLFYTTQATRKQLTVPAGFVARVTSGDPRALGLLQLLAEFDLGLGGGHGYKSDEGRAAYINAIDAMVKVYEQGGEVLARRVLRILTTAYRGSIEAHTELALTGGFLRGLYTFLVRYGRIVDDAHLIDVLSRTPEVDIIRTAKARIADRVVNVSSGSNTGSVAYAQAFHLFYNRGLRTRRLEPWRSTR